MKMLLIIYSGAEPERVEALLERHEVHGYTRLAPAHGAGATGRRAGTRAWPGDTVVFLSVIAADRAGEMEAALREERATLGEGDRMHGAVMPVDSFF